MTVLDTLRTYLPTADSDHDPTDYRFQYCPHCGEWQGNLYSTHELEKSYEWVNIEAMHLYCPNCRRTSTVEHIKE